MAGQAFLRELKSQEYETIGLSRNGPDLYFDALTDMKDIEKTLINIKPDLLINCAAMISLQECTKNPQQAKIINSILPKVIVGSADTNKAKVIHISTDHVFDGTNFTQKKMRYSWSTDMRRQNILEKLIAWNMINL